MDWALRGASFVTKAASTTSKSIDKPAGTAAGDLMLILISSPAVSTPTMPAGWTQFRSFSSSTDTTLNFKWYYKVALASEDTSYNITNLNSAGINGIYICSIYGKVLDTTPFDKEAQGSLVGIITTTKAVPTGTFDNVPAGDLLIACYVSGNLSNGSITYSTPTGMAEAIKGITTPGTRAVGIYFMTASAGTTGTKSSNVTTTTGSAYLVGYLASFNAVATASAFKDKPIERGICRGIF